jgi:hypothetical protein
MTVSFKSPVSSPNVNNAYLSRLNDTVALARYALENANPESGAAILNLQRALNKLFSATGVLNEINDESNNYATENYIENGQTYKAAIEALDVAAANLQSNIDAVISIIESGAFRFKQYESDNAYETGEGIDEENPLTGGEAYYNTTIGSIRFYDSINEEWLNLDAKFIVKKEIPTGAINNANTTFILSSLPISDDAIDVYIDGLIQKDYTVTGDTIELDSPPIIGQIVFVSYLTQGVPAAPILTSELTVQYLTVTEFAFENKVLLLNDAPLNGQIMIDVCRKVIAPIEGVDFELIDDDGTFFIGWDGFGLESDIAENDVIRVAYLRAPL